jgi:hypothetical protein
MSLDSSTPINELHPLVLFFWATQQAHNYLKHLPKSDHYEIQSAEISWLRTAVVEALKESGIIPKSQNDPAVHDLALRYMNAVFEVVCMRANLIQEVHER